MNAKTDNAAMDAERLSASDSSPGKVEIPALKTTKTGIPLHPQPSDDPEDPLVCRDADNFRIEGVGSIANQTFRIGVPCGSMPPLLC